MIIECPHCTNKDPKKMSIVDPSGLKNSKFWIEEKFIECETCKGRFKQRILTEKGLKMKRNGFL